MPAPYIPLFDGVPDYFGEGATVLVAPLPPRIQWESFAGVNGSTSTFMGGEGYRVEAVFTALRFTTVGLALFEGDWYFWLQTGLASTLVDSMGRSWRNTVVVEFEPVSEIHRCGNFASDTGVSRDYRAVFRIPY